jgi:hypothetical protein
LSQDPVNKKNQLIHNYNNGVFINFRVKKFTIKKSPQNELFDD